MKINELFKHRSVTSCLNDSYHLMADNLKDLVKNTWMAVLPYAFLTALFVYLRTPNKFLHDWGENNPVASFSFQTVVYLGFFVVSFMAGAAVWRWVTGKSFAHNLQRYTLVTLSSIAVIALFVIVGIVCLAALYLALGLPIGEPAPGTPVDPASPFQLGILGLSFLLYIILYLLAYLPFAYIVPRYMLLEKGEALRPWKSFKVGLRHCGAIFKMGFLGGLLIMVCNVVLYIPMAIITGAQVFSQLGVLDGDPAGVPGYFTVLNLVVSTLVFFIYYYIVNWLLLSFIYLYGSIECDEKEKAKLLAEGASQAEDLTKEE